MNPQIEITYTPELAVEITSVTLVGVHGSLPYKFGNCFSVTTGKKEYRIVNFIYENIEYLLKHGVNWPVEILTLNDKVAVIHDKRISDEWYSTEFCTVCCPQNLLPNTQQLKLNRHTKQGLREEFTNGLVKIQVGEGRKKDFIIYPPKNIGENI